MADKTYDEYYEAEMGKRLAAGKVVRMYRTTRGWQYITNKPKAINQAKRQSYVPEQVATAAGVPLGPCGSMKGHEVPAEGPPTPAAATPKRGPGRPRKVKTEDGE